MKFVPQTRVIYIYTVYKLLYKMVSYVIPTLSIGLYDHQKLHPVGLERSEQ